MRYIFKRSRFLIAGIALIAVFVIGTVGYMVIEDWSFLDSLFMTAITISTVGYDEVEELSHAGQIFSIVLIISGVGIMFYTVTMIAEYIAEGQFGSILERRRMKDQISKLKDHVIVCGYGRVGHEVVMNLKSEGAPLIVVEKDQSIAEKAVLDGHLCLQGDVTRDEVLKQAGIERARALIAAVGNDVDNVFVTLSARELRPDIFIAARASADDSEYKLRRAGADRVVLPERLGGRRMAMVTLHPRVIDFIDTTVYGKRDEFSLEDISITSDSPMVGMTVAEGQRCCGGLSIVALKKKDGSLISTPPMETLLEAGDEILAIGTKDQLRSVG